MRILNYRIIAFVVLAGIAERAAAQLPVPPSNHPFVEQLCGGDASLLRMDAPLLEAKAAIRGGERADAAVRARLSGSMRGGRLQVIVACTDIPATVAACRRAGFDIVGTFDNYGLKNVTIRCDDPSKLDALLALPTTTLVKAEPTAFTRAGVVAGQGDVAMNAAAARSNLSIDGTGVRVGVISDSIFDLRLGGGIDPGVYPGAFTGTTDQVSGDLPASVWVIDPGPGGNTDEGNGMAQIVHDIAPGADISFASAFTSYFAFASNITALHTDAMNPADVICDDVGYFAEPVYQDGPIALAYEGAFAAGVPCFSSAGNSASNAHEGPYVDSNGGAEAVIPPSTGADLHNFGGGDRFLSVSVPGMRVITVILHWNQPYGGGAAAGPGSQSDFNLYLTKNTTLPMVDSNTTPGMAAGPDNVVARSVAVQGIVGVPFGDSFEIVQVFNNSPTTQSWHIAVDHFQGAPGGTFHLEISGATIVDTAFIGSRTITGHPAAANVMATGASYFCEITGDPVSAFGVLAPGDVFSPFAPQIDVESFSSRGGSLPFFFDAAGLPMATQFRNKPEIVAPDGVNTTFFGQLVFVGVNNALCGEDDARPNFFGTSAASPHAAAAAALLLEHVPPATPSNIYTSLRQTAIDLETAGGLASGDFLAGDGLIDVEAAAAGPLYVELDDFHAENRDDGTVAIDWSTAAEVDSAGFHVYRADTSGQNALVLGERLTQELIPAAGEPSSYGIVDTAPPADPADRWYYLEEISLHGRRAHFGPVQAQERAVITSVIDWSVFE